MSLINVEDCQIKGEWTQDPVLESPNIHLGRIQIPYIPPEEFDLEWVIEPIAPVGHCIAIGLGQFHVLLADKNPDWDSADQGAGYSLERFEGEDNPSKQVVHNVFQVGKRAEIVCKVRKTGVTVKVNEQMVIEWEGDLKLFSQSDRSFKMPYPDALFLSPNYTLCRIHSGKIRPIDVPGKTLLPPRLTTPESLAAAADIFGDATADVYKIVTRHGRTLTTRDDDGTQVLHVDLQSLTLTTDELDAISKLTGAVTLAPSKLQAGVSIARLVGDDAAATDLQNLLNRTGGSLTMHTAANAVKGIALDLSGATVTSAEMARFGVIPDLDILSLERATLNFDGADLNLFDVCQTLLRVSLWNSEFDRTFLPSIARSNSLRELNLSQCKLTDSDIDAVASIASLQRLQLDGCRLDGPTIIRLVETLPNLSELSIDDQNVSASDLDAVLTAILELKHLERLSVRHWLAIDDSTTDLLSQFTQLQSLNVDRSPTRQ